MGGKNQNALLPVIIGLGGLYFVVAVALTVGLIAYVSGTDTGPDGAGPLLSQHGSITSLNTSERNGSRSFWSLLWSTGYDSGPHPGGMYTCETCRGYPNGAHYSRDSWRWQD